MGKKAKYTSVRIIFLGAIIMLLLLSFLSFNKIQNLIDESKLVNHSNLVMLQLEKTYAMLIETESNRRAYMLTKDSVFFLPMDKAINNLNVEIDMVDSLTKDNLSQQKNIIDLRSAIKARLDILYYNFALWEYSMFTSYDQKKGKDLMDNVRKQINKMINEEDELLRVRSATFTKSVFVTPFFTIVLILGSITILIASYFRIMKGLKISDMLTLDLEQKSNDLLLINKELNFQNEEKEKRAAELAVANKELNFQNEEKEKRAAELVVANAELILQNEEKEKRAAAFVIANKELNFQNEEKEKRAAELAVANKELNFQNEEKEKRAAELVVANAELILQNEEKEKRAAELVVANAELILQNEEKEKRAAELVVANAELILQNEEKEKRAAAFVIANKELNFQNEEKEKRARELNNAVKELESFNYISSHDLQEPLRKIRTFASRIISDELQNLSEKGKDYVMRMEDAANRMQILIADLLAYSRTTSTEKKFEITDLSTIIEIIKKDFEETILEKEAIIEVGEMCDALIIPFQFRQLMDNIIGNAIKFAKPGLPSHIKIKSRMIKGIDANNQKLIAGKEYCHITISDNGIGFEPKYKEHIFELFKRLHDKEKIRGTGIGLTIVKKIVENHNGLITATSELNKGATFDIYIPNQEEKTI